MFSSLLSSPVFIINQIHSLLTGGNISLNHFLSTADELPHCVRTFGRAQILFLLAEFEPTTVGHIESLGFRLNQVRNILREFATNKIALKKHHLYRLTEKGKEVKSKLRYEPLVAKWVEENQINIQTEFQRPTVTRLSE